VRSRLIALVIIPTVTAIALGGLGIDSSVRSALTFHRIHQLAVLSGDMTGLAQALEDERDTTAGYIAAGRPSTGKAVVQKQYAITDPWAAKVRSAAAGVGNGYEANAREKLTVALARIGALDGLRSAALDSQQPPLPVITEYSQYIADLFSFNDEIAQGSSDPGLTDSVRTLGFLSRMKDQASQQRAILSTSLIAGQFQYGGLDALTSSIAQQASDLAAFQTSATLGESQYFTNMVTGSMVDAAQNMEQRAVVLGTQNKPVNLGTGGSAASQQWYGATSDTIGRMRSVEQGLVNSIIAQSSTLQDNAARSAMITGAVVLIVLLLVLILTTGMARSMVRPLRRLRAGALEVAGRRLPEAVRRLHETDGASGRPEIEPIGVSSTDEIGEVARAFDQVHREALRLAADEALLRGSVNGMFVNLSRRTQTLVERQLRLIDRLEQTEQDSARLANLFQMDHMATRMRRNSENLLVLAGHEEAARRWTEPAAVVDVLRAAISEIEQYERVLVDVQPGLAMRGQAISDTVHLLAEILENATAFSATDTRVNVTGRSLSSGGFLLEITDTGVGMTSDELADENWRLDNPPVVDVAVSRRMGLFVVGRLAARHNIRVRLRPSDSGGLTALVWIPDSLIVPRSDEPGAWQRRAGITSLPGLPAPAATGRASRGLALAGQSSAAEAAPTTQPQSALSGEALARQSLARRIRSPQEPAPAEVQPPWETERAARPPAERPDAPAAAGQPAASAEPAPYGQQPAATPAAGIPSAATPASGFPSPATPAAEVPSPATPASGFPSPATPAAGFPSPATPASGFPSPATPAAGFPSPATPAAGFPSAVAPPPGLPSPRIPGAGSSPHKLGREGDRPGAQPAATAATTGPYAAPVIVPPALSPGGGQRLPIFDLVESEWFRSRGEHIRETAEHAVWEVPISEDRPASAGEQSWTSPADEGFSAAQAASEPAVGELTAAGLPRRVPQANAVPGSVTAQPAPAAAAARSPEAARSRLEAFQQGVRQARAAIATEERPDE
jgi:signal transduction histidine kinase